MTFATEKENFFEQVENDVDIIGFCSVLEKLLKNTIEIINEKAEKLGIDLDNELSDDDSIFNILLLLIDLKKFIETKFPCARNLMHTVFDE